MKYLAIDTSGKSLTVIINNGREFFSHHEKDSACRHSVELMPTVEKLIEDSQTDLKDLDFFAVVVGAGSFTGIRIGVSTIKAMCFSYDKPCLVITSFDTIAYNREVGKVLALIDAKHNGFYACGYEDGKVTLSPRYIMREEVLELLKEYQPLSFESIDGLDFAPVSIEEGLKRAIEKKSGEITYNYDLIEPLYVRKSQAEEGR